MERLWNFLRSAAFGAGILAMIAVQDLYGQEPRVFVLDDAVKMSPDGKIFSLIDLGNYTESNPVWDGKAVQLTGARGETVAFQVMVRSGKEPITAVNVHVSNLDGKAGSIPAGKIALFREWYVKVTRPSTSPAYSCGIGEYPDALIPGDVPKFGLPVDVAAEKTQGIWVDVAIPPDAKAGSYSGGVTVSAPNQPLAKLPVTLEVYDFAVPVERHLRWRIGYGGFGEYLAAQEGVAFSRECGKESDELRRREEQLYRLSWSHRFVPTTHYTSPIPEHAGTGANLKIDWTSFDRRFGKYLDGSAFDDKQPVNIFSLPINLQSYGGWPVGTNRALTDQDVATLDAACRQTAKHWDEKGWRLEDTFVYVADEPGPQRYPAIKKACEVIHKADKRIRTSVALYTHFGSTAPGLVNEFSGFVTMWDIAGDYMNLPALAARHAAGDTVGFYQGSEPFEGGEALDGDGFSLTTWPWIAWRYKLDTLFLYNMTEWDYARLNASTRPWAKDPRNIWVNPMNQGWQTNSQGVLLYPGRFVGTSGVLPSIRMKQIRRGMQDYEYFWLAAQKGKKTKADDLAGRIIPKALHEAASGYGDRFYGKGAWERDPRKWSAARRELAAAILE